MNDMAESGPPIIPSIQPGTYRHYKNKMYRVHGVAIHSETHEIVVIYEPLYKSENKFWVRPYDMFVEAIEIDGKMRPRFEYIGE
jgi:hypothetical protein